MRKTSYLTKTVSDSVLGLALLATPLAFLASPLSSNSPIELTDSPDSNSPVSKTSLGRFLESEIGHRIERVSGKALAKDVRLQRSRDIAAAVAEASYTYGVDPFLILSMIEVESRYNVNALGSHGEIGLMQIKPSTASWVAPVTDALLGCDLHGIRCNIMMGTSYVGHLQVRTAKRRGEIFGNETASTASFREHVLRSYNLGPAKANRLASDRIPATDRVTDADQPMPYATKIAKRADRLRHRYLSAAETSIVDDPSDAIDVAMIH